MVLVQIDNDHIVLAKIALINTCIRHGKFPNKFNIPSVILLHKKW